MEFVESAVFMQWTPPAPDFMLALRFSAFAALTSTPICLVICPAFGEISGASMPETDFITAVITNENIVSPDSLAGRLRITKAELACALGLSRDSVSKKARIRARSTQRRLRDMVEIINRVLPWAGTELSAFAWYRSQPLPSFGDMTAEDLVSAGRGEAVKDYLSRIAAGGYA